MSKIYFDYAAATPMSQSVLEAMTPYFTDKFYNPSALYLTSQDVKAALSEARSDVAKELGCKSSEIIFVSGGTESDNLAVNGVMQQYPGKKVLFSAVEHDAVGEPAKQYNYSEIPVHEDGRVDLDKLAEAIDDETVLVSIMYANNEIGTIQPIREAAKVIKAKLEERKSRGIELPLYFHTDACQAVNYLPLLVNTLGVDMMTLNGGKIYGPKQSGILFIRTGVKLKPQILGGGQERGIRSGTENVPAIVGFARALKETSDLREKEEERLKKLQHTFITELSSRIPNVLINGSEKYRLPNNVHLTFPGQDNERLMMELDELGIMTATGSACSASSDEPSHVLKAIGLSDEEARASLRITFGRQTDEKDIKTLLDTLLKIC